MMKKLALLMAAALSAVLLTSCAQQPEQQQRFQVVGQATEVPNMAPVVAGDARPTSAPAAAGTIDFDDGSYDPASEDGIGTQGVIELNDTALTATAAPVAATPLKFDSAYAGATPVVIDPIDKPTPSPVPAISFTYQTYDATKLHLSFEGPAGWVVDDVQNDVFTITNPDTNVDYQAFLTIRVVSLASSYTKSDLNREVKTMLTDIGSEGFSKWSPSKTAERTLMDKAGVYANYTGTLTDGRQVAGRVQATCIGKTLYTVHISYPAAYADNYNTGVYNKMRSTIAITK